MGFADMLKGSGVDPHVMSGGGVSSVGGNSSKAVEFAANICTKLGNCASLGADVAVAPTGRAR